MSTSVEDLNKKLGANAGGTVLDHPAGLFILFFTEMWERFSFYGMRALLMFFLLAGITDMNPGWGWNRENAALLYMWYTSLVYLTPLIGGWLADRFLGFKLAVVIGALLMTLGHASLAFESQVSFYIGLILLIIGNGFFKPNISSMVGSLYEDETKKDGAYTIFYMGVNAGAFFGFLLCGYIGETVGWHYGFGLAGIFMFLGLLQFYFAGKIFNEIGSKPKVISYEVTTIRDELREERTNEVIPGFNQDHTEKEINEKMSDSSDKEKLSVFEELRSRVKSKVETDRLIVIGFFAFFVIFFWWAFEQAGSSMAIFARDYTQRSLTGTSATIFFWTNLTLTLIPMIAVTLVLFMLFKQTFKKIPLSNIFLSLSFIFIWSLIIWKIYREFTNIGELEVPATWFGILNSFFIITLAPLFSKLWASKFNPSGPVKFALGLILLGIGFAFLSFGARSIEVGSMTASVTMFWLIAAYFFHTVGELCLSPVGLSYVSKLTPKKLVGLMFGVWYLSNFIAHFIAGLTASKIDSINEVWGLSGFFMLFTVIPIAAGLVMLLLTPFLKKRMHGIH